MTTPDRTLELDWRYHIDPETGWRGTAAYSPDQQYRYLVTYHWETGNPRYMTWIMLNLWALRSTDPRQLSRVSDPIGPANDEVIDRHLASTRWLLGEDHLIVCGWGGNGPRRSNRPREVYDRLIGDGYGLRCLKVTTTGQPAHPLYLPGGLTPKLMLRPPSHAEQLDAAHMGRIREVALTHNQHL